MFKHTQNPQNVQAFFYFWLEVYILYQTVLPPGYNCSGQQLLFLLLGYAVDMSSLDVVGCLPRSISALPVVNVICKGWFWPAILTVVVDLEMTQGKPRLWSVFDDYENVLSPTRCQQSIVTKIAILYEVLIIRQIPCIPSYELAYWNLRILCWDRVCACSDNPYVRTEEHGSKCMYKVTCTINGWAGLRTQGIWS